MKLYGDGKGGLVQVPGGRMAKRAQAFLFIALQRLSSKIANINAADLEAIEQHADTASTAMTDGVQNRIQPY